MKCYIIISDDEILELSYEEAYDPSTFNLVKKLYLQNQAKINILTRDDKLDSGFHPKLKYYVEYLTKIISI